MKFEPVSGTSGAPAKDTASEPVQDGGNPLCWRRKVAVPENGSGGARLAIVRRRSNLKSEREATTETQRTIEIAPLLSVELAEKRTCRRWRPITVAAKPNVLCAVAAVR